MPGGARGRVMRNSARTTQPESRRRRGAQVELAAEYAPDDERQARALLLFIGLPAAEIEAIIVNLKLDSDREM